MPKRNLIDSSQAGELMMNRNRLTDEEIDGWWDIARAGTWSGSAGGAPARIEISGDDLAEMAASYDPRLQEAPVTVEHQRQGPAHGWVAALRVVGDRLQARFKELSASLREWLANGAYRSRSIEMYRPFEPTGKAYLGAVSFLGAALPAVKGLSPEPSAFAGLERKEMIRIDSARMELAEMPMKGGKEMDEKTIAERVIHSLREMFAGRDDSGTEKGRAEEAERISELSRQVTELKEMLELEKETRLQAEGRLAALEEDIARKEREAELLKFSSALEQASREDRITPAELAGYLKLGSRLDAEGRRVILEEVAGREPSILFRELAPSSGAKNPGAAEMNRQRARFAKFPEDPEHDQALKLMAANPGLSFGEAIERVRLGASN
jgi:hypothetical protein